MIGIEGNKTESRVVKKSGTVKGTESYHVGNGKFGYHSFVNLPREGFSSGRTIELRRFEFCRIKLGISLSVPNDIDSDIAYSICKKFILEMIKREEYAIKKEEYTIELDGDDIDVLSRCLCRTININYGLTLKANKDFESHQVDVIEEIPVSDGDDIFVEFEKLSDEMAKKLDEEHSRIKEINSNNGL